MDGQFECGLEGEGTVRHNGAILLCPEMTRRAYGIYCLKNTEKMQDCQCQELEAPVARSSAL